MSDMVGAIGTEAARRAARSSDVIGHFEARGGGISGEDRDGSPRKSNAFWPLPRTSRTRIPGAGEALVQKLGQSLQKGTFGFLGCNFKGFGNRGLGFQGLYCSR